MHSKNFTDFSQERQEDINHVQKEVIADNGTMLCRAHHVCPSVRPILALNLNVTMFMSKKTIFMSKKTKEHHVTYECDRVITLFITQTIQIM